MAQQVFISYSQKDSEVAQAVCAVLEQNRMPCWIAPRNISPGQDWPAAITQAIRTAKLFVLIFSEKSNASVEVQREVQLAVDHNIHILPFRIEDFQLSPKLDYYLSSVQWLKAFPPPPDQFYPQLVITARQALGLPEAAEPVPAATASQPETLPLTGQTRSKNNLPQQLTSFIGREKEMTQVKELLRQHRLVTLTGMGGTGKTRLSLQVGQQMLDAYPDGVRLVELAPLADPELVPQTVIRALGQTEQAGKSPMGQLEDYLQPKKLLLILDNCEHMVEACAGLAAALLPCAPGLAILASSREILGVEGEMPFHVPPLTIPASRQLPPLDELARNEAMRLFIERAQVVSPGFTLTSDNAAAVAQITRRLDGIPLAIELAAARLRMLSVDQIAARLNDAFRLLTGGARTALPRHQTLQALIDWSYNLLTEEERSLLRSLSVFAGGWTLAAAEEVCSGERVAAQDILDLLGKLADKSLIQAAQDATGEMRYRMLETVRQYAHTRLVEAGEAETVRQRHLDYFLRLAEGLEPRLRGREQIRTLDYWENELDNLRLALEWALQTDIEVELHLAAALQWFWHIRTHWTEGIAWLEQGLTAEALSRGNLPPIGPRSLIRAKALTALGFQYSQGADSQFTQKSRPVLTEAIELYRANDPAHQRELAWPLVWLSNCSQYDGDPAKAEVLAQEALSLFRQTGDQHGMSECLNRLGSLEIDPLRQRQFFQEQLAIDQRIGDIDGIATALFFIGNTEATNGDYADAITSFEASVEHYRRVGNPNMVAAGEWMISIASHLSGDLQRGALRLEQAIAEYREMAIEGSVAWGLFGKALLAFSQGQFDQITDLIEEISRVAQKNGDPALLYEVIYLRARLARLHGDTTEWRRILEDGLNSWYAFGPDKTTMLLEFSQLLLQDGDPPRAAALCREVIVGMLQNRNLAFFECVVDRLAVLALREGRIERAARLYGTRQWRGWSHLLSPIERAARDAAFVEITTALGKERFAALQAEGYAMTFMQVLALAQEATQEEHPKGPHQEDPKGLKDP